MFAAAPAPPIRPATVTRETSQLSLRVLHEVWEQLAEIADDTRDWELYNVVEDALAKRLEQLRQQDVILPPPTPTGAPGLKPAGQDFPRRPKDATLKRGRPADHDGLPRGDQSVYIDLDLAERWLDAIYAMGERKSFYTEAVFQDYIARVRG